MLGTLVQFRICFFQAVRIVALERSFNFMDQRIDLRPVIYFDLIADQRQSAADRRQQFVALEDRFSPETFSHVLKSMIQRLRDHFFHGLVRYVHGTAEFDDSLSPCSRITSQHVQDAVGIDFKLYAHPGETFCNRLKFEIKSAQAPNCLLLTRVRPARPRSAWQSGSSPRW